MKKIIETCIAYIILFAFAVFAIGVLILALAFVKFGFSYL